MPILSFVPQKYDVIWDGISCAAVTFGLTQAGPYSATAYQVFTTSGEYLDENGESFAEPATYERGERYFTEGQNGRQYAQDQSLTVTASGSSATVVFSSLDAAGPDLAFAWSLRVTGGNVLVAGRIDIAPPSAYDSPNSGTMKFVTGVTATSC